MFSIFVFFLFLKKIFILHIRSSFLQIKFGIITLNCEDRSNDFYDFKTYLYN